MKWIQVVVLMGLIFLMVPHSATSQKKMAPQYLTIVADISKPTFLSSSSIYVSVNGEQYRQEKINASQVKGKYDLSPLIDLIRHYHQQGWELVNSNLSLSSDGRHQENLIFLMMTRDSPQEVNPTPIDTLIESQPNPASRPMEIF